MEGREIRLDRWKDVDVVVRQGRQQHVRRTIMQKFRLIVGVGRLFVAFKQEQSSPAGIGRPSRRQRHGADHPRGIESCAREAMRHHRNARRLAERSRHDNVLVTTRKKREHFGEGQNFRPSGSRGAPESALAPKGSEWGKRRVPPRRNRTFLLAATAQNLRRLVRLRPTNSVPEMLAA
jgi:hypothetical protein